MTFNYEQNSFKNFLDSKCQKCDKKIQKSDVISNRELMIKNNYMKKIEEVFADDICDENSRTIISNIKYNQIHMGVKYDIKI